MTALQALFENAVAVAVIATVIWTAWFLWIIAEGGQDE